MSIAIRAWVWACLLLAATLAGCGDDPPPAPAGPERVAQVFVAKGTRPVIVSWLHAGAGATEYVVYRIARDGSTPAVEIARKSVGNPGQRVYVHRDAEVDDATPFRYGVAVAGAGRLTETTFSDERAAVVAASGCQVQDISLSDVDGDGISNEDEFEGWQIFIAPLTASPTGIANQLQRDRPVLRKVSSSPFYDDTDGDGLCDWQEHAQAGSDPSSVLLNAGRGAFAAQPNTAVAAGPAAIVAVDLNGDGLLDLATANAQPAAAVTVLYARPAGAGFQRQDMTTLGMRGTALVADTFQSASASPSLAIVATGFANPSGYQLQFLSSLP